MEGAVQVKTRNPDTMKSNKAFSLTRRILAPLDGAACVSRRDVRGDARLYLLMKTTRALTLIELLVVIAIIAVLASLLMPVFSSVRQSGNRTHAMGNLRQLSAGMILYANEHHGVLPWEGEDQPTWESAALPENATAWYNAVPRALGTKGAGDFAAQPESFYTRKNLLFIPAAQYPGDKKNRLYFAVSMNSKLRSEDVAVESARLVNIGQPARTVLLQESGLPGEKPLPGQSAGAYDGRASSYAAQTVARYSGKSQLVFADGHVELLDAKDVVDPRGQAFFPQIGDQGGKVLWTLDPTADANE